ncbi:alpha/beta hydrolase family protein [Paramicrobacterium agarici]|uniref:Alpha-beta hydrolase superfamily lysophospholipase n=1 Tax=Paramicrobacterium agarici TaxID=630514 RepID=A0A2A9DZC5_9MICO|nr:alpha/beta fold hydrolase [Microbacterium agarici]PFG31280.1 alpha-beta hydrolase superfamily lysophospholipase [Microbacterium agarici]TQO24382.1 alpha-beta hydrolase superfamily lysophospholipase [Microbacterium agarici]
MKRPCHADRRSRRLWPLSASALAVAAFGGFAGVTAEVARRVVIPDVSRANNTKVVHVDASEQTITLSSTPDTRLPGRYGLWVNRLSDYVRLGEIVAETPRTVTRRVLSDLPDPVRHGGASFSGWYYRDVAALGLPVQDWDVPTENGAAPAWYFPSDAPLARGCAVLVHGRGVQRNEVLRAVPVIRAQGYDCLAISYRNDGDAAASRDGRYMLGQTEWKDVDAAMREAARAGHTRFVLMGWSMGGAVCLQTAARSERTSDIAGLILESPVVDWRTVLRYQARASRIPSLVRDAAMWLVGSRLSRLVTGQRIPIDFDRLDRVAHAVDLRHPVLILHSDDDGFVPSDASHALAEARPDLVTLDTFAVARHTKLWNYDSSRWNRTITRWLASLS